MKHVIAFALMGLSCSACTSNPAVQLRWDAHAKSAYRITKAPFPDKLDVDVEAMLSDPALLNAKINALKSLPLDPDTFPMRLTLNPGVPDRIKVLAKNTQLSYATPAITENEKRQREMHRRTVGLVQLNTVINQFGENLNPFLKKQQNNLVSQLFQFPRHPVSVGDSWRLPIVMTSLNTPFLADKSHRVNKVWIKTITEKPGIGKVAEIIYLLQENVEGQRQQLITETPSSFKVTSNYFAVGEYLIDKHRWQHYVGRLETAVGVIRNVSLIALVPATEVKP